MSKVKPDALSMNRIATDGATVVDEPDEKKYFKVKHVTCL